MAVVINTNTSASFASAHLSKSSDLLQKSLARLSSGSRIANPADDAGGLAVSMKLAAAIKRTDAAAVNVSNAISFLQTQAGSLKSAASVLDRMSELATLNLDVTKSASDRSNYDTEFNALYLELGKLTQDAFNGINMFSSSTGALTVYLSQDGVQTMQIDQSGLGNVYSSFTVLSDLNGIAVSKMTQAIQDLATLMATNGAQSSRLQFALDSLNINKVNLEAANSRIYDVDVAAETTKLARANILVQSGASMLSQANAASQIALKLLQ
jgi:flagellin